MYCGGPYVAYIGMMLRAPIAMYWGRVSARRIVLLAARYRFSIRLRALRTLSMLIAEYYYNSKPPPPNTIGRSVGRPAVT